jgi:hypothetical protein
MFPMPRCLFKEWLYGPKNQWPEPPKQKENKKQSVIYRSLVVMCKCRVESNYGLVPSGLGIGHYYGHMVDYDEVGYFSGKHGMYFIFLSKILINLFVSTEHSEMQVGIL